MSRTCLSFKWGEFNPLVCCREEGHEGPHNYVCASSSDLAEHVQRRAAAESPSGVARQEPKT